MVSKGSPASTGWLADLKSALGVATEASGSNADDDSGALEQVMSYVKVNCRL